MQSIAIEDIEVFDLKKMMKLGSVFDGMSGEEIVWKLTKAHKNNDRTKSKQYVVHGFYFDIYIGEFHLVVDEDQEYSIKPLSLEPAKCKQ